MLIYTIDNNILTKAIYTELFNNTQLVKHKPLYYSHDKYQLLEDHINYIFTFTQEWFADNTIFYFINFLRIGYNKVKDNLNLFYYPLDYKDITFKIMYFHYLNQCVIKIKFSDELSIWLSDKPLDNYNHELMKNSGLLLTDDDVFVHYKNIRLPKNDTFNIKENNTFDHNLCLALVYKGQPIAPFTKDDQNNFNANFDNYTMIKNYKFTELFYTYLINLHEQTESRKPSFNVFS
jgi:hypothetical protein